METVVGRIIIVVTLKIEFDYRNKNLHNFLIFLTVSSMIEESQTLVFQPNQSQQSSAFRLGP